ncbi:MAG: hypothetical protein LUD77_03200 [Clostridiales bacterium]|nr:hypothetical protein [Clostridiales bacterium]
MNKKMYAFILVSVLTLSANIFVQAEEQSEGSGDIVVSGAALTVETEESKEIGELSDDEEVNEEDAEYNGEEVFEEVSECDTDETQESTSEETAETDETAELTDDGEDSEDEYVTLESLTDENSGIYTDCVYYNGSEVVCQWIKNIDDTENIIIEYKPQDEEWQSAEDITYITNSGFYIKTALLEENTGYAFRPCYNEKKYKCFFYKDRGRRCYYRKSP